MNSALSGCPGFHKVYCIHMHIRVSYICASKWKQVLECTQCQMILASAYHLETEIIYWCVGFTDILVQVKTYRYIVQKVKK
jgi:hypothetical protein